uniref:BRI3 binding protein n=1 Tax=Monodelphis domestica TaxID=13616 RepID=A0A5F8HFI4_MONDO
MIETLWSLWTDLLEVLGIDASNLTHYFRPEAVASNPSRALLLIVAELLAYWFLSLFLGFLFHLLHMLFGRFFWVVRVTLFVLSCVSTKVSCSTAVCKFQSFCLSPIHNRILSLFWM